MAGKRFKWVVFLVVYLLIFWIGFRSGEIYNRMKNKLKVERIIIPEPPPQETFFIIEKHNYGTYVNVTFEEAYKTHPIIRFFLNEKLRPLLKSRDIEIYTSKGERIH